MSVAASRHPRVLCAQVMAECTQSSMQMCSASTVLCTQDIAHTQLPCNLAKGMQTLYLTPINVWQLCYALVIALCILFSSRWLFSSPTRAMGSKAQAKGSTPLAISNLTGSRKVPLPCTLVTAVCSQALPLSSKHITPTWPLTRAHSLPCTSATTKLIRRQATQRHPTTLEMIAHMLCSAHQHQIESRSLHLDASHQPRPGQTMRQNREVPGGLLQPALPVLCRAVGVSCIGQQRHVVPPLCNLLHSMPQNPYASPVYSGRVY